MSAVDAVEDKAKARAEERAERELLLKVDALELERLKFRYTQRQSYFDRLGAASVRGAAALLFANGSTILVCMTSYKPLVENLGKPIFDNTLLCLLTGFITATVAFVVGLILSTLTPDIRSKGDTQGLVHSAVYGVFSMASLGSLALALLQPIWSLKKP